MLRYITGPALAWQLDDDNAGEHLGRFGSVGKGARTATMPHLW